MLADTDARDGTLEARELDIADVFPPRLVHREYTTKGTGG